MNDDGFEQWMRRRNLTQPTIKLWGNVNRRFAGWHGDPLNATHVDIEAWLWVEQPHVAPATRMSYRKGLRAYYQWALREGLVTVDPTDAVPVPQVPHHRPRPIPTALLREALTAATPKVRATLCLGCYQGLRTAEMAALRVDDVTDTTLTVWGKGRKQRSVPLHDDTKTALAAIATPGELVLGGITGAWVSVRGSRFLHGLGWDHPRPMHSLRAWYATSLYRESGKDLFLVRDMLGHSSTDLTALYVGIADGAAAAAVSRLAA